MLTTQDGRETALQVKDLILFRREKRQNRIYVCRNGKPLLVNGKEYFSFPRVKSLAEQFRWMCWFADAVGDASLVGVPPDRVMVAKTRRLPKHYFLE